MSLRFSPNPHLSRDVADGLNPRVWSGSRGIVQYIRTLCITSVLFTSSEVAESHFNEVYPFIHNLLLFFSLTRVKYGTLTIRHRRLCSVVVTARV